MTKQTQVTIKTGEAMQVYDSLNNFINKDIDLPAQVAWDLDDDFTILRSIADKLLAKQSEIFSPLIKANIVYEADDGALLPREGHKKEFDEAVEKLHDFENTDNEITITKISKTDLPDKLSVKDLVALKFLLKED